MSYYVYILRSLKNDSFYKGSTDNLEKRLIEHNDGKTKSTARYAPWKIEWYTTQPTRSGAIVLEKKLKNITSRIRIKEFINKHQKADVL
ncbi:MAG TPA: GIY-YIG nuclease family protein [Bacteroidia bacterium]|nr:GIY-YIG nuclease family protein [Bacteroidia bacterium]